jgi:hypothetical protein
MTEVTVTLPDDLAQLARKAGLLRPEALARASRNGSVIRCAFRAEAGMGAHG